MPRAARHPGDAAARRAVIYEVSHRTAYSYSQPVSISHHLLHLTPRECRLPDLPRHGDRDLAGTQRAPADVDYFGNPTTFVTIQQTHTELGCTRCSIIEVRSARSPTRRDAGLGKRRDRARGPPPEALEALEFTFASPYVPIPAELRAYAAASFPAGRPVLEARTRPDPPHPRRLPYDPSATTLATGVAEAFDMRARGLPGLRPHRDRLPARVAGLPARYVSGYLLTRPPRARSGWSGPTRRTPGSPSGCRATTGSTSTRPTT